MKRFIQALSILLILSALTSLFAALGVHRLPDRSPPADAAPAAQPLFVEAVAVEAVAAQPAGSADSGSSLLERLMESPRIKKVLSENVPTAPSETVAQQEMPKDLPLAGEEEHIEGTDKPEAFDETPATEYMLPDTGTEPVLVNRDNPLPPEYVPVLAVVPGTYYQLTPETLEAYQKLMAAAREAGHTKLRLQSAYRSYETQYALHERKVNNLKAKYGDEARAKAAQIVARPGESEHQLGQAADIANGSLVQSFGDTPAGIWMAENVHKYGFILRYPKDKTHITGILYEPWHFRYVGVEVATIVYENGWTLEEYFLAEASAN